MNTLSPNSDKSVVGFFMSEVSAVPAKVPAALDIKNFDASADGATKAIRGGVFIFNRLTGAFGAILRVVQSLSDCFLRSSLKAAQNLLSMIKIIDGIFFEVNFTGMERLITGMENNGF